MSKTLSEKNNIVILLDGIETLIAVNGFDPTFEFLQSLWNEVTDRKARMIMPINKKAVEQEKLGLLESRMNIIKPTGE